jgi:tetratricopeptide (TPR) repeat protein
MNESSNKWLKFGIPTIIGVIALGFLTDWGGLKGSGYAGGGCQADDVATEEKVTYAPGDLDAIVVDIKEDSENRKALVNTYVSVTIGIKDGEARNASYHRLADSLVTMDAKATTGDTKEKLITPPPGFDKVVDYKASEYLFQVLSQEYAAHYATYLGDLTVKNDQHKYAKAHFDKALEHFEASLGSNTPQTIDVELKLADLSVKLGNVEDAKASLNKTLSNDAATRTQQIKVRLRLADIATDNGELRQAAIFLIETLNILDQGKTNHSMNAYVWMRLGDVGVMAKRLEVAKEHYLKALEEYRSAGDQESMGLIFARLVKVQSALKDLDGAKKHISDLDLAVKGSNGVHVSKWVLLKNAAEAKHVLAKALEAKGDPAGSQQLSAAALADLNAALKGLVINFEGIQINGDDLQLNLENFDGVKGTRPGFSVIVNRVGILITSAEATNSEESAKAKLNQALVLSEKFLGPKHPKTADVLEALADLHVKGGDTDTANKYLDRCIDIRHFVYGENGPQLVTVYELKGSLNKELPDAPNYTKRVFEIKANMTKAAENLTLHPAPKRADSVKTGN